MPRNQIQRAFFAFVTVLITVHAYVFYSLYVVNGNILTSLSGEVRVLAAVKKLGGVYMFGHHLPIWAVVLVELCLAYSLEMLMGSPCSFKLACKNFDPKTTHPVIFETAIICTTVALMCPAMSFLAAIMYYPYYTGFNLFTLLADWIKLVCVNFPFAFFSQLFFIQPLVRTIFRLAFKKDIESRAKESSAAQAVNEGDVIVDVIGMIDEIKLKLGTMSAKK